MLPAFGKGDTRFQPVYVGDIGRLVEILTRNDVNDADSRIIEAAGPDSKSSHSALIVLIVTHILLVFTFRQIMALVVDNTGRFRPIISVPWKLGELQGEIMQRLPTNLFTITRDQVRGCLNVSGIVGSADVARLNN